VGKEYSVSNIYKKTVVALQKKNAPFSQRNWYFCFLGKL